MRYPVGIQDFEDLRKGGNVYVDKTGLIYKMSHGSGKYFFLSRPRRFGKSLLVSTMDAYFRGRKELFKGLEIEKLEQEWAEYPVLRFDLSGANYSEPKVLDAKLGATLSKYEQLYSEQSSESVLSVRFASLIQAAKAKTGKNVVILIDEYDKPIIDNLDDSSLQKTLRNALQGFYSVMKENDAHIKFGFLTGVTKIGKLSVFSGLNNLMDISMDLRYSDICGVSESELKAYFQEGVQELAAANSLTEDECYVRLAQMYDGYHFHQDAAGVYNPFSLLNTFAVNEFREYWFETGTPTVLVETMKATSYDVTRLEQEEVKVSYLMDIDNAFENPIPLLYQSGYLTIKGYDPEYNMIRLGFPNLEVKHGFLNFLLKYYAPRQNEPASTLIVKMVRDVRAGRAEDFMQKLQALFARTSYQIQGDSEKDFQYAMYIILELMGEYVDVEKATSNGRMDITMQNKDYIYIIEIKTNDTVDAALKQIEEKGYAIPFLDDPRKIFKIGVRFSSENRRIDDWKVE